MLNGFSDIVLTKLDVLDGMEKVKVCVGYEYNGKILDKFPHSDEVAYNVKPVYKEFDGWDKSKDAKTYDQLPENAKKYIKFIEDELKAPISIVSVGPGRKATIVR